MTVILARRAAPLLITTILAAAPAWAQTSSNTASNPSGTAPAMSTQTAPATSQPMSPATSSSQTSAMPSGTAEKAMPGHSRQAIARQPGESVESLVERRIADLRTRLHITSGEDQQFNQFAQVMRDNAKAIDQSYQQRASKLASMSAVDNMQSYAEIEQQRAQDVQKLVPAFQTLYNTLTDQQKKAADNMFRTYAENAQTRRQTSTTR